MLHEECPAVEPVLQDALEAFHRLLLGEFGIFPHHPADVVGDLQTLGFHGQLGLRVFGHADLDVPALLFFEPTAVAQLAPVGQLAGDVHQPAGDFVATRFLARLGFCHQIVERVQEWLALALRRGGDDLLLKCLIGPLMRVGVGHADVALGIVVENVLPKVGIPLVLLGLAFRRVGVSEVAVFLDGVDQFPRSVDVVAGEGGLDVIVGDGRGLRLQAVQRLVGEVLHALRVHPFGHARKLEKLFGSHVFRRLARALRFTQNATCFRWLLFDVARPRAYLALLFDSNNALLGVRWGPQSNRGPAAITGHCILVAAFVSGAGDVVGQFLLGSLDQRLVRLDVDVGTNRCFRRGQPTTHARPSGGR